MTTQIRPRPPRLAPVLRALIGDRTVVAPAVAGADHVIDGLELRRVSRRYFNTPRWLALPSLI